MRKYIFIFFFIGYLSADAQVVRPKLIIGLVIDQMRWDYLYRFQNRYSTDGFKRLLREGFSCENTFIPYTPTYTAPGRMSSYGLKSSLASKH